MKRFAYVTLIVLALVLAATAAFAVSSSDILKRVKAAESSVRDIKAEMVITSANKGNVADMGEGYADILKLQKAVISYKRPDKIRYDGYARGIKAAFIQNGYKKLILAAMIRQTEDVKNKPGKRQDTLDLGFLNSRLWTDNTITVVSTGKDGIVKLKLDPKTGGNDKRHSNIWVDPKTLKVLKFEKYRGNGDLRVRLVYSDFQMLAGKLPIATCSTMYNSQGEKLGTVNYRNVKANTGIPDSLFSMSQR